MQLLEAYDTYVQILDGSYRGHTIPSGVYLDVFPGHCHTALTCSLLIRLDHIQNSLTLGTLVGTDQKLEMQKILHSRP